MRLCLCLHTLRHKALRLRNDHPVLFGDQKPAWHVLPKRAPGRHSDAVQRYRPLHGRKHCLLIGGSVLRERRREGSLEQPDQTIAVRCKLRRLGMGFEAIKHVRYLLALVGSKRGDVDQGLHSFGTGESDDRAGIGMCCQHDRTFGPVQAAVERGHVAARDVSGSGAADTSTDSFLSAAITPAQLDPSAHAPWASTTLTSFIAIPGSWVAAPH